MKKKEGNEVVNTVLKMEKGKVILISLALGLILMAFLKLEIPIYIFLGMSIFASILAIHELTNIYKSKKHEIKEDIKWWESVLYYGGLAIFYLLIILTFFVEIIYLLSVPISIYVTYFVSSILTIEELTEYQNSITLYTLGIVILTLGLSNSETQQ